MPGVRQWQQKFLLDTISCMEEPQSLAVLLERLTRLLQNDAHRDGLKPTQWEALRYLDRANRFSRTPGAVTAYLGTTKGTVSQTLSVLERKGLIRKTPLPSDRRNVRLSLTGKGRSQLERDPLRDLDAAAAALGARSRGATRGGLETLLQHALRQRGGRPFGVCRTCRFFQEDDERGEPHRCGLLDEPLSTADSTLICVEQEPDA